PAPARAGWSGRRPHAGTPARGAPRRPGGGIQRGARSWKRVPRPASAHPAGEADRVAVGSSRGPKGRLGPALSRVFGVGHPTARKLFTAVDKPVGNIHDSLSKLST